MADNQSRAVRKPIEKGTEVTSIKYPNGKWLVTRDEGDGVRVVEKDSDFATFFPDGTYDIIENNYGAISLKVDVDCSEALTGLKALTREARKATQAVAELESEVNSHIGIDSIDTVDTFSIKIAEYIADNIPVTFDDMYAILNSINHGRKVGDLRDFTAAELTEELAKRDGKSRYYEEIAKLSDTVPEKYEGILKDTNERIFSLYKNEKTTDIDVYFGRCVGVSTSCRALENTFDDVVFIDRLVIKRGLPNVGGKVVFVNTDVELPTGIIPKRIIRIHQVDNYGNVK